MLNRLSGAFEAQRQFVAHASHELRTPLTVQRAAIDVALEDPAPTIESMRTMALRVRDATERNERLIASLLTLARSQAGIERFDDVDLAGAARTAIAAIPSHGVTLQPMLEPAHLAGDPGLVERLIVNLVDNAVRPQRAGRLGAGRDVAGRTYSHTAGKQFGTHVAAGARRGAVHSVSQDAWRSQRRRVRSRPFDRRRRRGSPPRLAHRPGAARRRAGGDGRATSIAAGGGSNSAVTGPRRKFQALAGAVRSSCS
jgi:His Kinase A (phospho-acceptor) domain